MSVFCARKAVYNRENDVCSYELLVGDKENNNEEPVEKALDYICNYATEGLMRFTNNKKAFVKFTEMSLIEEIPDLIGKENIIVNISGDVTVNDKVKKVIKKMFNNSFQIAYDISSINDKYDLLDEFVHIYKINFKTIKSEDRDKIINSIYKLKNKHGILAFNISNQAEYKEAFDKGIEYFSGDYFSKPVEINNNNVEVRNSARFSLIIELLNEELEIDRVENIVKSDLSISYKLIKFLNSAVFGFTEKIKSIRQAIMLLGKEELRKWLTLIIVSDIQRDNNEELVSNTIIRARFCELIAAKIDKEKSSMAFMVGLFSDFQNYVNKDINEVVAELNFQDEINAALLGEENTLWYILELEKSYEKMDVVNIKEYCRKLDLDENSLFELYSKSIEWLNDSKINFNKM
ncbi:MAG: HDOD domain-containing protein [Clostridiales bacterium]|nr:HDOD domain-containing protein [Clostridiales bacterium]